MSGSASTTFLGSLALIHTDALSSDHNNPEAAINQILAIAPILPGQQQTSSKPNPDTSKNNASENAGNLIDFGDDDKSSSAQETTGKPQTTAAQQGLLDESSDENSEGKTGRARQSSLMAPLEPTISSERVQRVDSTTSEIDEFVDAQG